MIFVIIVVKALLKRIEFAILWSIGCLKGLVIGRLQVLGRLVSSFQGVVPRAFMQSPAVDSAE